VDRLNDLGLILASSVPAMIAEYLVNVWTNMNMNIVTGLYHYETVVMLHEARSDKEVNLLSNIIA
jgi:hypothetical protein